MSFEDILNEEESDFELGIDLSHQVEEEFGFSEEELQRTEDWQEKRRGNWTGSAIKELMSCNPKGGKLSWADNFKFLEFSKTAIKYIFANAMERKTGRYIEGPVTNEMYYGTVTEPLSFKRANEKLKEKGLYLEKVGFKEFDDVKTAGVSSDSIVRRLDNNEIVGSAEIKACTSWGTLYERTYERTNEKSKDFWQTQAQCKAWGVDKTFYIVISPPKNFRKYLLKDDAMELYNDWISETEMNIEEVDVSSIHIDNMIKRIMIAETVVMRFLETERRIEDLLHEEIDRQRGSLLNQSSEFEKSEFERAIESVAEENDLDYGFEENPLGVSTQSQEQKIEQEPELNFDDLPF